MGVDNSCENSNQYLFEEDEISDYDGLKSNASEEKEEEDEYIDFSKLNFDSEQTHKIKELSNATSEKIEKIPITFEWDNGGNTVYVTGSFCNWKQDFLMKKEKFNRFLLTLNLPKGYHQYKFKVDNEWKYNEKFPTCDDGGNINNYLDTTNWEITVNKTDEGTTIYSTNITDNDLSKLSKMFKEQSKNSAYFKMKRYSDYIPNKDEFSEKIPEIPNHYQNNMNINLLTNQNNLGNTHFLKISENNIMSDNIAFKNIVNIYHEQTNHLRTNINNKEKNDNIDDDNKPIICSISSRYRLKFTTFVYYNTQKNENMQC
jgi:hypothetical protein